MCGKIKLVDYLPYRRTNYTILFYCSSMHLYLVHCKIIDVNIGILIKGAILNMHHMTLISTFIITMAEI